MDFPTTVGPDVDEIPWFSVLAPDAGTLALNLNRIFDVIRTATGGGGDTAIVGFDVAGCGDGANYLASFALAPESGGSPDHIPLDLAVAFAAETGEAGGDVSAVENVEAIIAAAPPDFTTLAGLLQPTAFLFGSAIAQLVDSIPEIEDYISFGLRNAGATSGRRFVYLSLGVLVPVAPSAVEPELTIASDAPAASRRWVESVNVRAGKKRSASAIEFINRRKAERAELAARREDAKKRAAKKAPKE